MSDPDARARLILRVKQRLVAQGLSNEGANRTAQAVVANYYEGAFDAYYWLVQAEAMTMVAEIIPPLASNMAAAWQGLANTFDAIASSRSNNQPSGCVAHGGPDCVCDDEFDKEFPPSDFISGAPDHYHVNDYNDSCPHEDCRYGHHQLCQVWADPEWEHKPTLCLMTRIQCTHSPKHRYGQKCDLYKPGADTEDELAEAYGDNLPASASAPFLSVVPAQRDEATAFLHTDECVDKGRHLSGDCNKERPTCPHNPHHTYGQRCP